jgi:hypothetical protein
LTIFKGQTAQNKKIATEYVSRYLSEDGNAEIVSNVDTGCGTKMLTGVKSDFYGLVHITCSSNIDANGTIRGWGHKEFVDCKEIDHVAFVWADKSSRVLIFLLRYEDCLMLSKKNDGNYSKTDVKKHAIKSGIQK